MEVCLIPMPHYVLVFNYLLYINVSAKPINGGDERDNKISISKKNESMQKKKLFA